MMKFSVIATLCVSLSVLTACKGSFEGGPIKDFPVVDTIGLDSSILEVSVVAEKLDVPWEIASGPNQSIFISEQSGTVSRLDLKTGEIRQLLKIDEVWRKRTTGLLGMVLHPDMVNNPYVFVDYTLRKGKDSTMFTKLVRYTYQDDTLTNAKVLFEIEANTSHNGSRLAFSKTGNLLWATGDLQRKGYAQDSTSLFGKILSFDINGAVPADNPIKGSYVLAWGFRNMQGLTVSKKGLIYTSEHGEAIEDEINLIEPLSNYGWPEIEGFHDLPAERALAANGKRTEPIKAWTPTVAPAGLDIYEHHAIPEWNNALLLATLKGKSLHVMKLSENGRQVLSDKLLLEGKYGRLRDLCVSPEGDVYVATSNRDWNPSPGFPKANDDRILRIRKVKNSKVMAAQLQSAAAAAPKELTGAVLYNQYCVSCHKEDGMGVAGTFPPLNGALQVTGSKDKLVNILLNGLSGPIEVKGQKYDQVMPSFAFLSDLHLALISTYIRSSWTNNSNAVNESDIKKLRK